ncbi:ORF6N domain-containing protein [Pseudomonas shirazica]|uniref:ORF6N domain-containing protein n=1 Tax=Pseudomonas shirazica TaxID=1940636 RepID=UPI0025AA09A6|nr:ORF6N domain-containing protein [Pseudomonas shirazica]MDM9598608.1 ORF6N domain-containing protein [Pseudomonas shirazica]MDO2412036.1 ORF6N domain-containing protein [Pseudomonas shirazica]
MNLVTIHNTQLPVVEYRGQRVVTLAMIDQVHERPDDTAGRNFREHRDRLIVGSDYYVIARSENSEIRGLGFDVPNRGLIVLTEQGYLMLVKSLTDDLAWTVQRQLVNNYFRPQAFPVPRTRADALRLAADLEEKNELLALENQQQAKKIEALENLFMPGETVPQFAKRLNGVNSQLVLAFLAELKWIYNTESDPDHSPKYRVYAMARDRHLLTEKPYKVSGEGMTGFIRYAPVMLEKGAQRLHDLYMEGRLPMKKTWDGKFFYTKFNPENSL